MTQKQKIGVGVGVGVAVVLGVLVYSFYTGDKEGSQMTKSAVPSGHTNTEQAAQVPSSIDDISETIVSETQMDLSALDAEAAGETAEIKADSDSVNNLGTAYDESSY